MALLLLVILLVIAIAVILFFINNGISGANFDSCRVFVVTSWGTRDITPENMENYKGMDWNFVGGKCDEYRELYRGYYLERP